jgi:CHAD domain-containing protein
VRERQITKKIMIQASMEIPEEIDRQIQEKTRKFSEKIHDFQAGLRKFRSKSVGRIAEIDLASAVDFFEMQKKKIRREVLKHDPGMHWHEARKRMKVMMYMLSILPKKAVSEIGVNHKELDRIQELLGDWHDLEVLNQLCVDGNKAFAGKMDTHKLERQIRSAVSEL